MKVEDRHMINPEYHLYTIVEPYKSHIINEGNVDFIFDDGRGFYSMIASFKFLKSDIKTFCNFLSAILMYRENLIKECLISDCYYHCNYFRITIRLTIKEFNDNVN